MSEARSYDETTVQAPTKSVRNMFFKQTSQTNNEVKINLDYFRIIISIIFIII